MLLLPDARQVAQGGLSMSDAQPATPDKFIVGYSTRPTVDRFKDRDGTESCSSTICFALALTRPDCARNDAHGISTPAEGTSHAGGGRGSSRRQGGDEDEEEGSPRATSFVGKSRSTDDEGKSNGSSGSPWSLRALRLLPSPRRDVEISAKASKQGSTNDIYDNRRVGAIGAHRDGGDNGGDRSRRRGRETEGETDGTGDGGRGREESCVHPAFERSAVCGSRTRNLGSFTTPSRTRRGALMEAETIDATPRDGSCPGKPSLPPVRELADKTVAVAVSNGPHSGYRDKRDSSQVSLVLIPSIGHPRGEGGDRDTYSKPGIRSERVSEGDVERHAHICKVSQLPSSKHRSDGDSLSEDTRPAGDGRDGRAKPAHELDGASGGNTTRNGGHGQEPKGAERKPKPVGQENMGEESAAEQARRGGEEACQVQQQSPMQEKNTKARINSQGREQQEMRCLPRRVGVAEGDDAKLAACPGHDGGSPIGSGRESGSKVLCDGERGFVLCHEGCYRVRGSAGGSRVLQHAHE